jgi:hypothetical protein
MAPLHPIATGIAWPAALYVRSCAQPLARRYRPLSIAADRSRPLHRTARTHLPEPITGMSIHFPSAWHSGTVGMGAGTGREDAVATATAAATQAAR